MGRGGDAGDGEEAWRQRAVAAAQRDATAARQVRTNHLMQGGAMRPKSCLKIP